MTSDTPLLVLDLDETVIFSCYAKLPGIDLVTEIESYYVHQRPFLPEFLKLVSQWYRIGIWTAASKGYAHAIVESAIRPIIDPLFVWDCTRCTPKRNFEADYWVYTKPLIKIKRSLKIPLEKILIIEDDPLKVMGNYGSAIFVTPFRGDAADSELRNLANYLEHIRSTDNFRALEKRTWRTKI